MKLHHSVTLGQLTLFSMGFFSLTGQNFARNWLQCQGADTATKGIWDKMYPPILLLKYFNFFSQSPAIWSGLIELNWRKSFSPIVSGTLQIMSTFIAVRLSEYLGNAEFIQKVSKKTFLGNLNTFLHGLCKALQSCYVIETLYLCIVIIGYF